MVAIMLPWLWYCKWQNCDVTMVLVLQMANIGGQLLRNEI